MEKVCSIIMIEFSIGLVLILQRGSQVPSAHVRGSG